MDISLALGGGGYKGVAHIGVIESLEIHGFKVRAIAGTSAGGLVGAAYAAGNTPAQILQALQTIDRAKIYRRHADDGPSLMGHAGMVETLSRLLGNVTFDELKIPFACTAVDLNSSREVYLREGIVIEAAAATMAVPGILPPIKTDSSLLVDGAVLDPVPVALARILAPDLPVVAVVLSPAVDYWDRIPPMDILAGATLPIPLSSAILQSFSRMRLGQALRIFSQSMEISTMMLAELRLKIDRPDVILRPEVHQVGMFDLVEPDSLVIAGHRAVEECLADLRRETSWRGRVDRLFRRIKPIVEPQVLRPFYTDHSAVEEKPVNS